MYILLSIGPAKSICRRARAVRDTPIYVGELSPGHNWFPGNYDIFTSFPQCFDPT